MNGLKIRRILVITLFLMPLFWGSSLTYAQQTTEQFIPIGMSPGISNDVSHMGNITSVDKTAKTFSMQSNNGTQTVTVSSSTRIWLDRSKVNKSNIDASFEDLVKGRMVEVMPGSKGDNVAEWVKIESS